MDNTLLISALVLGFGSGFHCIGMCGPIALSMGLTKYQAFNFHLQNLTYNVGRIFTYTILGAILGLVGQGFEMVGFQKYLTILVGITLIIMALFSFGSKDVSSKIPFINSLLMKIKMNLGKLLQQKNYKSRFATGLLNGLLPCGMVYMALTASMASGGIWEGAVFMSLFGLGTLPFMFVAVLLGNIMNSALRIRITKIIPVLMMCLGVLFIIRGLELGIPYVSPKSEVLKVNHIDKDNFHNQENSPSCH